MGGGMPSPDQISAMIIAANNATNNNPTDAQRAQLEALKNSNDIANTMWQRYQSVYAPLQDKVVQDAETIDSPENLDHAGGIANATVTNQFDQQRKANLERLRQMGVNPNSGAFIDANSRLAGSEAAANAGAQNTTRFNLQQAGRAARGAVATGGAAIPGQSTAALTAGASGLGSAAGQSYNLNKSMGMDAGAFLGPLVGGIGRGIGNWINSSGPMGNSATGDPSGGYFGADGVTPYAGAMADGGPVRGVVRGPGTGTSDSIPVAVKSRGGVSRGYLSDGEFVVPADVVRAKGTEFFNKMIESYHTPVRHGVRR